MLLYFGIEIHAPKLCSFAGFRIYMHFYIDRSAFIYRGVDLQPAVQVVRPFLNIAQAHTFDHAYGFGIKALAVVFDGDEKDMVILAALQHDMGRCCMPDSIGQ